MQVYVLTQGFDYEGEVVLGVYSDQERAQAAASDYVSTDCGGDTLSIYEIVLDEAVRFDALGRYPLWQVSVR